jgi:hypothetical protein
VVGSIFNSQCCQTDLFLSSKNYLSHCWNVNGHLETQETILFIMANTKTVHVPHLGGIDAGLVPLILYESNYANIFI